MKKRKRLLEMELRRPGCRGRGEEGCGKLGGLVGILGGVEKKFRVMKTNR